MFPNNPMMNTRLAQLAMQLPAQAMQAPVYGAPMRAPIGMYGNQAAPMMYGNQAMPPQYGNQVIPSQAAQFNPMYSRLNAMLSQLPDQRAGMMQSQQIPSSMQYQMPQQPQMPSQMPSQAFQTRPQMPAQMPMQAQFATRR